MILLHNRPEYLIVFLPCNQRFNQYEILPQNHYGRLLPNLLGNRVWYPLSSPAYYLLLNHRNSQLSYRVVSQPRGLYVFLQANQHVHLQINPPGNRCDFQHDNRFDYLHGSLRHSQSAFPVRNPIAFLQINLVSSHFKFPRIDLPSNQSWDPLIFLLFSHTYSTPLHSRVDDLPFVQRYFRHFVLAINL